MKDIRGEEVSVGDIVVCGSSRIGVGEVVKINEDRGTFEVLWVVRFLHNPRRSEKSSFDLSHPVVLLQRQDQGPIRW